MGRRRRKKARLWTSVPLWLIAAGLVGWGLWNAAAIKGALQKQWAGQGHEDTAQPEMAVGAEKITAQGAQGGEPWSSQTVAAQDGAGAGGMPPLPTSLAGVNPALVPDGIDQTSDQGGPLLERTPVFAAGISAEDLRKQGLELLNAGNVADGRFALNAALARTQDAVVAAELRATLADLNQGVFLGSEILPDDPCARLVEIQEGDSFLRLGREFGVPAAFLQALNPSLSPEMLKPLTGVKIVQGPFHVRVFKRDRRLDLYARDIFVRSFAAEFPEGNDLPGGEYEIAPGTKLQLGGSRTWIGFEGNETATQDVTAGWIFGSAGPRGSGAKDRATGIHLADSDLAVLYNVLSEGRSRLRVEP